MKNPEDIVDAALREAAIAAPQVPPALWHVDLKFQANENAWLDTMTEELWKQLKEGDWRLLSIGFDMKHGVGAIYIKLDSAPHAEDTHAAILKLAKVGEEMFKAIAIRAAHTNQL